MERKCVKLLQLNSRNNPIGQQVLTYFKIGQLGIGPKAGLFLYKQLSSCFCIQRKQSTARSKLVKPASRFSLIENIFRWGEGSFVPRNVPQTSNRLHPTCWCRKQSFLTLCLPRIERIIEMLKQFLLTCCFFTCLVVMTMSASVAKESSRSFQTNYDDVSLSKEDGSGRHTRQEPSCHLSNRQLITLAESAAKATLQGVNNPREYWSLNWFHSIRSTIVWDFSCDCFRRVWWSTAQLWISNGWPDEHFKNDDFKHWR